MLRSLIGRWLATAGLVVLMVTVVSAQQRGQGRSAAPRTGPPSMDKVGFVGLSPVQEELKLDEKQKAKVGEMVARLREAIGEQPTDLEQWRDHRQTFGRILAEQEEQLDEVLSEDQRKRLYEIRLQIAGTGAFFREDVASRLDLSDEQKERLQALVREHREKVQRGDARPSAAATEYFRAQIEQQLTAVLSEDQKKKWEELQGEPFRMFGQQARN